MSQHHLVTGVGMSAVSVSHDDIQLFISDSFKYYCKDDKQVGPDPPDSVIASALLT